MTHATRIMIGLGEQFIFSFGIFFRITVSQESPVGSITRVFRTGEGPSWFVVSLVLVDCVVFVGVGVNIDRLWDLVLIGAIVAETGPSG